MKEFWEGLKRWVWWGVLLAGDIYLFVKLHDKGHYEPQILIGFVDVLWLWVGRKVKVDFFNRRGRKRLAPAAPKEADAAPKPQRGAGGRRSVRPVHPQPIASGRPTNVTVHPRPQEQQPPITVRPQPQEQQPDELEAPTGKPADQRPAREPQGRRPRREKTGPGMAAKRLSPTPITPSPICSTCGYARDAGHTCRRFKDCGEWVSSGHGPDCPYRPDQEGDRD